MENYFNRVEKKFYLKNNQVDDVLCEISPYVCPDKFSLTNITSIYLDDTDHNIINRSIEKPRYKEKIRIREYGNPGPGDPIFVEIKKKFKGVVYKRRVQMTKKAAEMFLSRTPYLEALDAYPLKDPKKQEVSKGIKNQIIANEITAFMDRHNWPKFSVAIKCQRQSYKAKAPIAKYGKYVMDESQKVRITFDRHLEYCSLDQTDTIPNLENSKKYLPMIPSNDTIMEAKFKWGIPIWLIDILTGNKIYTQGFSKVGTAYLQNTQL